LNTTPAPGTESAQDHLDTIDVVSDVVCPWCYIGKRQLEAALAALPPDQRPQVRWHPFQLNPDLPREGTDRRGYLEAKFGGPRRAAQVYERVRQAGAQAGIAFDFDAIAKQPNTIDAHRLVAWAQTQPDGDSDALVEGLFRAYFLQGRFVGDHEVLVHIAADAGFDASAAAVMLASDSGVDEVAAGDQQARDMGIGGVPFFVFNGKVGVSGAQGADALRTALAQSRQG
jgi:predicted DsbA family dithiol-disulfide isomerase